MNKAARGRLCGLLFLMATGLALLCVGCGGGGHGKDVSPASTGTIYLRVDWPTRTGRLIPLAAESVTVVFRDANRQIVDEETANRFGDDATTTAGSLLEVPAGRYFVTATAYPRSSNINGDSGVAQAQADFVITVSGGRETVVNVSLNSNITTLSVEPANQFAPVPAGQTFALPAGQTETFVPFANNVNGDVVITRTEQFVWQSSDTKIASVDANGIVTGQGVGQATITVRDTESGKTAQVGVSVGPVVFRSVDLAANDLVYDAADGRIYVSVPASAGGINANCVVPLDPQTLALGTPIPVGGEPFQMAISDDGTFLYVALRDTTQIRRVDLRSQTADLWFEVGLDGVGIKAYPGIMKVQPGHAHTLAVVLSSQGFMEQPFYVGVTPASGIGVFDDGVRRPVISSRYAQNGLNVEANRIDFGADPNVLYAFDAYSSGRQLTGLRLSPDGLQKETDLTGLLSDKAYNDLLVDGNRLYDSRGTVVDPAAKAVVGTFPVFVSDASFLLSSARPDSRLNRVFFLTQPVQGAPGICQLRAFDATTFAEAASLTIGQVQGYTGSLIRWGDKGLAFRTTGGKVFVVATAPGL